MRLLPKNRQELLDIMNSTKVLMGAADRILKPLDYFSSERCPTLIIRKNYEEIEILILDQNNAKPIYKEVHDYCVELFMEEFGEFMYEKFVKAYVDTIDIFVTVVGEKSIYFNN